VLRQLFDLEPHGPDTFVGTGLLYPWGGLYGGHIVAQALRAAAMTVDTGDGSTDDAGGFSPHSLRAYFIRRGDHAEPVRYEVDRIRNGRSFSTRRVVARQAIGAILNLEASFQRTERSDDVETVVMPTGIPRPADLPASSWSEVFERHWVPDAVAAALPDTRARAGRALAWLKVGEDLGDDQLLQRCALAYLSDDLPTDSVVRAIPRLAGLREGERNVFSASLDHTVWFHRPLRADRWHLHDFACLTYVGTRGLAIGHVFAEDGLHVATVAQEVLLRVN
jgi:acyl-CoA thioesterase-2